MKPTINLFWNAAGELLLQCFRVDAGGFTTAYGDLVRLDEKEFRSKGLSTVLECLKQFNAGSDPSMLEGLKPKEWSQFRKEHKLISVRLAAEHELELEAMKSNREGWVTAAEPVSFSTRASQTQFYAAVQTVLKLCH